MQSVVNYYISPEGWGKFNYFLHRVINTYRDIEFQTKICDKYIRVILIRGNDFDGFCVHFDVYNSIVKAITEKEYYDIAVVTFQRALMDFIWETFYKRGREYYGREY